MPKEKIFTLEQANALLPKLKSMLASANQELTEKAEILATAYADHESCEQEMSKIKAVKVGVSGEQDGISTLRDCRLNFQTSIEALSQAKQDYIEALNYWLEEISQTGIILRDIKSGLSDFPAESDGFQYYLCWQASEENIQHWHLINDGFIGRRPLAVLSEYL